MKRGLGRGLDALFSIYEDTQEGSQSKNLQNDQELQKSGVEELDIKLIDPNKNQPRKYFEPTALKELSESIKQHGIIQPIIVNKEANNRYTIIAGERRFRASIIAGLLTIPAIVKNMSQREVEEVALIENLQREDLNPIEAAKAIKQLMNDYQLTQDEVADKIGKSRPLVANTLRLLMLSPSVIELIEKNKISAGHGRCLVTITDYSKQLELANIVIEKRLSVRDLEKLVQSDKLHNISSNNSSKAPQSIELKELRHRIQRLFGTKTKISGDDNKGKIVIEYYNRDDLDRLSQLISKIEK